MSLAASDSSSTPKAFVLRIVDRYGTEILSIHKSEPAADQALANYARNNWEAERVPGHPRKSDAVTIAAYFKHVAPEDYDISPADIASLPPLVPATLSSAMTTLIDLFAGVNTLVAMVAHSNAPDSEPTINANDVSCAWKLAQALDKLLTEHHIDHPLLTERAG